MKIALLKGNRFNPWHLRAFERLGPGTELAAFRAESEIQRYFGERGGDGSSFPIEPIHFDDRAGPIFKRLRNRWLARQGKREPRILPFHERLRDFDLLQSWELFTDWSAEAVKARLKYDIPLCVMVWDNIPFNMERNPQRRRVKERVAHTADRFIVHTERSRRMLDMEGVEAESIVKLEPGVDTTVFSPGAGDRPRFGLAKDAFVVLFVGWLLPRKGLDFLLLALRELLKDPELEGAPIQLLVVGSGPGKDRIETLVERLGVSHACTFAGSLDYRDMPTAFRTADAFVLPSIATPEWQEQFGMSLIEAMACGVPVISTLSGAIPEMAGDDAVLCQPNDFVSLYEALKDLVRNPAKREDLARRGRERALERFELDRYAKALSEIYASLIG